MFKKIIEWFLFSSANPNKLSLTLKAVIPFIALLGVTDSQVLESTSNAIIEIVVQVGVLISGFITLYGAVRKVVLTFFPPKK